MFEKTKDRTIGRLPSPNHQKCMHEQHDARFPPDLLPYGQPNIIHQGTTAVLENGEYIAPYYKDNTTNILLNCSQDLRIYQDCSSSSCSVSNRNNNNIRQSVPSTPKVTDTLPCKPRQSIVRTSPSFSFLSAGYQQQNNFL